MFAWVIWLAWLSHFSLLITWPEGREGWIQAGLKGHQLEVGARMAPWLLVLDIWNYPGLLLPAQAAKCASENSSDDSWDLSNCRPPHHPITCKDGIFSTLGCQVCSGWRCHLHEHLAVGQGAPAYGSAPHFLSGSSELSSNATIKGLKPSRELHTTFLNVEPLSGVAFQVIKIHDHDNEMGLGQIWKSHNISKTFEWSFQSQAEAAHNSQYLLQDFLQAHKRIQISFPMEPISQISILEKVNKLLFKCKFSCWWWVSL